MPEECFSLINFADAAPAHHLHPKPAPIMLLRNPSELSAGEIALWDAPALSADMPDAASCASAEESEQVKADIEPVLVLNF